MTLLHSQRKLKMQTLTIDNLLYEEIVLLQNVLLYIQNDTDYLSTLDYESQQIFNDLYEKVIQS